VRRIIHSVDENNNLFYCIINGRKVAFYLTKRLAKVFMAYLDEGVLVDFEISETVKKFENFKAHQIAYFNEIKILKSNKTIYNHAKLKSDMLEFLEDKSYYLIADLEMTMPSYRQKKFIPEIIQYGFVLVEYRGKTVLEDSSYIFPIKQIPLSKRTVKFLKLDQGEFNSKAQPYNHFYTSLEEIVNEYQPKIVVWGKNDIVAIEESYKLHNKLPLTKPTDFIDLSKLHKDYFNLRNDLGLFKAYETYYQVRANQIHSAKEDAKITKNVFEAFINYINEDINVK